MIAKSSSESMADLLAGYSEARKSPQAWATYIGGLTHGPICDAVIEKAVFPKPRLRVPRPCSTNLHDAFFAASWDEGCRVTIDDRGPGPTIAEVEQTVNGKWYEGHGEHDCSNSETCNEYETGAEQALALCLAVLDMYGPGEDGGDG